MWVDYSVQAAVVVHAALLLWLFRAIIFGSDPLVCRNLADVFAPALEGSNNNNGHAAGGGRRSSGFGYDGFYW